MGQQQNKTEIVYGDDCPEGFDPGKTPKYVYARFSKLVKCDEATNTPPNDRVFKLTQMTGYPCNWRYHVAPWDIYFIIFSAPARMFLRIEDDPDYGNYFIDTFTGDVEEGHIFHNENLECGPETGAIEGIATVTWQLESLKLMGLLNIKTQNDLFMEMRPLDDGSRVYKYCNLRDATNIAIKFEPE